MRLRKSPEVTEAERQASEVEAAENRERERVYRERRTRQWWMSRPEYRLESAAAQLAISLTQQENVEPLVKNRLRAINDVANLGDMVNPADTLTDKEREMLPAAQFVIESLESVMNDRFELKWQSIPYIGYRPQGGHYIG